MKKVFITVAFLAGFFLLNTSFSPKSSPQKDITFTENGTFSLTGQVLEGLCVGEDITLVGDLNYFLNIVFKPNGGYHETNHFSTRSLRGIGTSGKLYLFQEGETVVFKAKPSDCRLFFDRVFTMKIISRGSSSNYYMKLRLEGFFNACEQLTTIVSREITEECR